MEMFFLSVLGAVVLRWEFLDKTERKGMGKAVIG